MNKLQQSISIVALNIKSILDKILTIIIEILPYIKLLINLYLVKRRVSTTQKIMYKGYGLLYGLIQIGAIYIFSPCMGLSALHSFCTLAILETLAFMGIIKQVKIDRYKWLCNYLQNGKI
uniref:Uncharacterized protein n=1 Tax=Babesia motasi TaxID=237580 RepID=A0A411ADH6_9APIC|nr:hypothetical protein [Babesia motasi]